MDTGKTIEKLILKAVEKLGMPETDFLIEHPTELLHGDYSANIALILAKKISAKPREVAEKITAELSKKLPKEIAKVEVAGPGFINFYFSPEFFEKSIKEIVSAHEDFGKNKNLKGEKVLIEHTSPNAFKLLHIGHFMANAIGESVARMLEYSGAKIKRASYASDIGLPVAKAVWGMMQHASEMPDEKSPLSRKIEFIANAYTHASTLYESDPEIKTQIDEINVHIYKKDEENIVAIYEKGKRWSLEYLQKMYERLGTTFDYFFFESEVFDEGTKIVRKHLGKVFEESEGAIVFRGEDHGLHTRVFVTSKGNPTYEAKELGLHEQKGKISSFDRSIVVTGNEQAGVITVGLKAFEQINPKQAEKVEHITHGLMLGPDGKKMASRKGGALSAEELIDTVKKNVLEKMNGRDLADTEAISEKIALGAVRYQILKQGAGKNIIFDIKQALSFEGDSGPYLQYTAVRAQAVLEKAKAAGIKPKAGKIAGSHEVLHLLYRFPEIVERASAEYAPHYITAYLTGLASAFNTFYAKEKIVDANDEYSPAKVALTAAVRIVIENGLYLLGIEVPEKM